MLVVFQPAPIMDRISLLIEYCIYGIAFTLPLSLDVSSLLLTVASALWLGKMVVQRQWPLQPTPFDGAVLLFVLLSALSILGSPDRGFSYYNYYHLMGRYIAVYYLVAHNIRSLKQIKRLLSCLLFSALIVAGYGFYQYIHGVDIAQYEWVDGDQFPELKMRVFSTLQNPNLLAAFLVVMMSITTGVGLKQTDKIQQFLLFVLVVVLGYCLVLTYSRGAWISLLAICTAYGMLYNRKIMWLFLALPILIGWNYEGVMDRMVSIVNPTDTSSSVRLALWESTFAMILNKPFLGIGWGAYWLVYPEYDFFNMTSTMYHAHNTYLHLAAEIGVPGLLIFLGIAYGHARLAWDTAAKSNNRWLSGLMLGIVTALAGLAINGFTDHVLYNIQLSMLFWLLNAIIVASCRLGHF